MSSDRTTIYINPEQRETLKKAAARFHLSYQTYMKSVALEHANYVLSQKKVGTGALKRIPKKSRIEIVK